MVLKNWRWPFWPPDFETRWPDGVLGSHWPPGHRLFRTLNSIKQTTIRNNSLLLMFDELKKYYIYPVTFS